MKNVFITGGAGYVGSSENTHQFLLLSLVDATNY